MKYQKISFWIKIYHSINVILKRLFAFNVQRVHKNQLHTLDQGSANCGPRARNFFEWNA